MKRNTAFLLVLMLMVAVTCAGCFGCDHVWADATCLTPVTCVECGETAGAPLGHNWVDATCEAPKTCKTCNTTEGEKLNHSYEEAVTKLPACDENGIKTFTCSQCQHSYNEDLFADVYDATAIYTLYENSLGEIITYDKSGNELALGTCFVYSADGKLVTNYHVIDGAYSAKVTIAGNTYDIQYVLAYDKNIDLAVLKVNASGLQPSAICEKVHATGSAVYAFGSSRGLTYTRSQGIITHANRVMDGVAYVQHDAAISGGNSGGPLINQYGEVIGINTMTVKDSQNLNFAVSVTELHNLNYGSQLTMREFYDKECNPYLRLKNYIMDNGKYYSSDGGYYRLQLGYTYSSDGKYKYSRYAYYYVSDGDITLDMVVNDGEYWLYITIDGEADGVYAWYYFDDDDYEMGGTLYAETFAKNTLLGYSYNNINYTSIRNSVRELASSMMYLLAMYIDSDGAAIGITAQDLGFLSI